MARKSRTRVGVGVVVVRELEGEVRESMWREESEGGGPGLLAREELGAGACAKHRERAFDLDTALDAEHAQLGGERMRGSGSKRDHDTSVAAATRPLRTLREPERNPRKSRATRA